MKTSTSKKLFRQAQKVIPGGVNSPVRAFRSVGGTPLFVAKAKGATVTDADGNTFLDYVSSWGPMILGHAHPKIVSAIRKAAERGTSYGAPTAGEITLAIIIRKAFPSIEKVRLVSSGTEAAMSAVRLARGFTGRDKIVKFEGCYHGHADPMLVKAGSGALTFGQPDSPGVPADTAKHTLTATFNNAASVRQLFDRNRGQIAAVIVEPIPGNMGVVLPTPGFLDELREITRTAGALLVFDEVITGFRLAYGGAQSYYNIMPDLTCLGKIIGGGLPVGAYGGKKEIMNQIAPEGPVYQAGTLSGNPLAMAAGIATLKALSASGFYDRLNEKAANFAKSLTDIAAKHMPATTLNRVGSMMTNFFTASPVTDFNSAMQADPAKYASFYREMLAQGIYLAPSQFEAMFISAAHSPEDLEATLEKTEWSFKKMSK